MPMKENFGYSEETIPIITNFEKFDNLKCRKKRIAYFIIWLIVLCLCFLYIKYLFFQIEDLIRDFGPGIIFTKRTVHFIFPISLFIVLISITPKVMPPKKTYVTIKKDYLELIKGQIIKSIPWNSIKSIREKIKVKKPIFSDKDYLIEVVISDNNKSYKFDECISRIKLLTNNIRKYTFPFLQEQAKEQLSKSNICDFGSIKLTSETIKINDKFQIKFDKVVRVKIIKGRLRFLSLKNNTLASVKIHKIKNIDVLINYLHSKNILLFRD
jgi:hypothetical protein